MARPGTPPAASASSVPPRRSSRRALAMLQVSVRSRSAAHPGVGPKAGPPASGRPPRRRRALGRRASVHSGAGLAARSMTKMPMRPQARSPRHQHRECAGRCCRPPETSATTSRRSTGMPTLWDRAPSPRRGRASAWSRSAWSGPGRQAGASAQAPTQAPLHRESSTCMRPVCPLPHLPALCLPANKCYNMPMTDAHREQLAVGMRTAFGPLSRGLRRQRRTDLWPRPSEGYRTIARQGDEAVRARRERGINPTLLSRIVAKLGPTSSSPALPIPTTARRDVIPTKKGRRRYEQIRTPVPTPSASPSTSLTNTERRALVAALPVLESLAGTLRDGRP